MNNITKYNLVLPHTFGDIVDNYLSTLDIDVVYDGYTLNDDLELIEVRCLISNIDDSQDELYIINEHGTYISKWWSINKLHVLKVQQDNIRIYKLYLEKELSRINNFNNA